MEMRRLVRTRRFAHALIAGLVVAAALPAAAGAISYDRHDYGVGAPPWDVAVGFLNGDEWPDIVTANPQTDNISVLLNDGTGAFGAPQRFGAGSVPRSVVVVDGKLAIANRFEGHGNVRVMGPTGGGVINNRVDDWPYSVDVGLFDMLSDDEGGFDLVTANYASGTVSVLLGDRFDGRFRPAKSYRVGDGPIDAAVIDPLARRSNYTNSVATANAESDDVTWLANDAVGGFTNAFTAPVGDLPTAAAAGYIGGLDPEVVVATAASDQVWIVGRGQAPAPVGDYPTDVALVDPTGSGLNELVVTANWHSDDVSVLPIINGGRALGAQQRFAAGDDPSSVAVGDFNRDGDPDLVTANSGSGNVSVLLNGVTPPNPPPTPPTPPTPPGAPDLTTDPSELEFGPQVIYSTSRPRTAFIDNDGDEAIEISRLRIAGGVAKGRLEFDVLSEDCTAAPLEPGDDCLVKLTFTPTEAGDRHAWLDAINDGPDGTVDVELSGEGVVPTCAGQTANVVGTPGSDVVDGTPWHDVVVLMGGDDIFRDSGSSDLVCGGGGDDLLRGGSGGDALKGGSGDDELFGGSGSDLCSGGGDEDTAVECERTFGIP